MAKMLMNSVSSSLSSKMWTRTTTQLKVIDQVMKRSIRILLHCLTLVFLLRLLRPEQSLSWPPMVNALAFNSTKNHDNLDLFKYEETKQNQPETTTTLPYYLMAKHNVSSKHTSKNVSMKIDDKSSNEDENLQARTDLYTVELTSSSNHQQEHQHKQEHPLQHHARQPKHEDDDMVFNYKCPKQHFIHPCDCLELDKRAEMFEEENVEGSGGSSDDLTSSSLNGTPTFEMIEEEPVHPDLIETVVLCKNIRNVQVLTEAVRGFQGYRVNYFVLDGCKLPPFPNNLFKGIHIVWMEILNSTIQFHDNFLQMRHCP